MIGKHLPLILWLASGSLYSKAEAVQGDDKVQVDVYFEALCPDSSRFLKNQFAPLWQNDEDIKAIADFNLFPAGIATCNPKNGGLDFECTCQHGPDECVTNQLMNCVINMEPKETAFSIVPCLQGKKLNAVSRCFEKYGVRSGPYLQCAQNTNGRQLMAEVTRLKPKVPAYVPWIEINGARVESAEFHLIQVICAAYTGPNKPNSCNKA